MEKKKYLMPSMKTVCLRVGNPILFTSTMNEKFEKNAGSVDDDNSTSFWETTELN